MIDRTYLAGIINRAYSEDIGNGDHSSIACIPELATGTARLLVKQSGIIAGVDVAREVFRFFDTDIGFTKYISDGQAVNTGDVVFVAEGSSRMLLSAERTVLNFMQRMSGIATETNKYVLKVAPFGVKILDTRKTTPGLRLIEKEAVRIGGGTNHRIGLYDMIMIKDNHVDFSGGIESAIDRVNIYLQEKNLNLKIVIEVRNFSELDKVLKHGGIHRIMLDNFSASDTLKAVSIINKQFEIESSGGITLDNIEDYAACRVDYISVGALTHHIKSLDLSLKACR